MPDVVSSPHQSYRYKWKLPLHGQITHRHCRQPKLPNFLYSSNRYFQIVNIGVSHKALVSLSRYSYICSVCCSAVLVSKFLSDKLRIMTASKDRTVHVWDISQGEVITSFLHHFKVSLPELHVLCISLSFHQESCVVPSMVFTRQC